MADVRGRPVSLAYSVGEIEIRDHTGRSVPVRRVLDGMCDERFANADDAVRAICAAADRVTEPTATASTCVA